MSKHLELAALLNRAVPLGPIAGREPNIDWRGKGHDKSLTICIRLTIADRDLIVRALRKGAKGWPKKIQRNAAKRTKSGSRDSSKN